jgi:hypothetical protein
LRRYRRTYRPVTSETTIASTSAIEIETANWIHQSVE